jgi:Tol biopolymer transport system component
MQYINSRSREIRRLVVVISVFMLFASGNSRSAVLADVGDDSSGGDKLFYTVNQLDEKISLLFFDPRTNSRTFVHTSLKESFKYSASNDGHLAYTVGPSGKRQIYVWDTRRATNKPIKLSKPTGQDHTMPSWSPDSRSLAYTSIGVQNRLYVWDGTTTTYIGLTETDTEISYTWSTDGRLAFVSKIGTNAAIYIWDGKKTFSISQNPASSDTIPVWSHDGKLAFVSIENNISTLKVWNGKDIALVSVIHISEEHQFNDYIPRWGPDGSLVFWSNYSEGDTSTLAIWNGNSVTKLPYEFYAPYTWIAWTDEHQLTFTTNSNAPGERVFQVYVWDGKSAINVSRNPENHNGWQQWMPDGQWVFGTAIFPSKFEVYVRDANNKTIFTRKGTAPSFSKSGYLAFCTPGALYVWGGKQVITVAKTSEVVARWQGASRTTFCSSYAG